MTAGLLLAAIPTADASAVVQPVGGETVELPAEPSGSAAITYPRLRVTRIVGGLVNPWDLDFAPGGLILFTERPGRIKARLSNGTVRQLRADLSDLWVSGETGMMSIEVDPAFSTNRRVYTCQGTTRDDKTTQVVAWTLDAAVTTLTRVNDPLVGGIDNVTGRHGGCQLRFNRAGELLIGTGDAAKGTNPQNLDSLAGKVLRVNRMTGAGIAGNVRGRVYTYGHRNVQGLALASNGDVYSVEHGTNRDDEVNWLQPGANYGWDPIPGYNEARPMTDNVKFPGAKRAVYRTGYPTWAWSGATFVYGTQWRSFNGALAITSLKYKRLRFAFVTHTGAYRGWTPYALYLRYGRLRGAEFGPDGALYLTTSNGGNDSILRVVAY